MDGRATTSPIVDPSDDASARIERLLAEVRASVSPLQWQRVDELIATLVDLYGQALGRMLGAVDDSRRAALAGDELVGSLLALHGLHPAPVAERVREALEQLGAQLGRLELVALADGVAEVRALDAPAVHGARALIERVVAEAAPEVARVDVDGLREAARPTGLVQIDLGRSRAGGG
jgi:hypothetical protein